jgi:hypothetical protein
MPMPDEPMDVDVSSLDHQIQETTINLAKYHKANKTVKQKLGGPGECPYL